MTTGSVGLILAAALLHATWNALVRGSGDRLWLVTVMSLVTAAVAVPLVVLLPLPAPASLPYLAVSTVLQVAYVLFLVAAYRVADLGAVYPVIRGSVPLLVTLGAVVFADEYPDPVSWAGVVLVSSGIMALAFGRAGAGGGKALVLAVATAGVIAAYTVTDGVGARLSHAPLSYTAWIFVGYGLIMPVVFLVAKGRLVLRTPRTKTAALAGVVQLLTYAVTVWALSLNPMGAVSALRELSVVFAALIGWRFLGERLTGARLGACTAIAAGASCLGLA